MAQRPSWPEQWPAPEALRKAAYWLRVREEPHAPWGLSSSPCGLSQVTAFLALSPFPGVKVKAV